MRSHRLQKMPIKGKSLRSITISDNFRFSKFEFMDVTPQVNGDEGDFTTIDVYDESQIGSKDYINEYGLLAVQDFSDALKIKRRNALRGKTDTQFSVDLAYEKITDSSDTVTGYKCVRLVFSYVYDSSASASTPVMNETVEIQVFAQDKQTAGMTGQDIKKYQLVVPALNLDSDVTEYLFRFTKGLTWGSETYAILDCNPNLAVNKGVYLTMNVPFESNIAWGIEKRKLIVAYRFIEDSSSDPDATGE